MLSRSRRSDGAGKRVAKQQGPSITRFAEKNFDVFITVDRKLESEHKLAEFRLGFIIVRVRSNRFADFRPILASMLEAVSRVRPGEVIHLAESRR